MKKAYQKPAIVFESFAVSTNIAGNCEVKTWTPNSGNCSYTVTDEYGDSYILFTEKVNACGTDGMFEADGYNGICYDVPTASGLLFNS